MRRKQQVVDSRRRSPKQARAKQTVDVILEAAALILEHRGRRALTTNRIAEQAGVGISTVYQYFNNKEEIVVALGKRERESHKDDVVKAMTVESGAAEPDRAAIRALLSATARRQGTRRATAESLLAQGADADITTPMEDIENAITRNAAALFPHLKRPMSPTAMFVLSRAVRGVVHAAAIERGSVRPIDVESELLILVRSYVSALA